VLRFGFALSGLLVVLLCACGALYSSTRGAKVERFELQSRLLHRKLREVLVRPSGGGRRPLLVLLHGRGSTPDAMLSNPFFRALRALGRRAPVVLLVNGGDHSYYHDRRDGPWGSYVVREAIPAGVRRAGADPRRVAIGGISMGGFGALDLARLHPRRFCAVGGHSAALWRSGGETAPGAFDNAADFARHDVIGAVRRNPRLYRGARLWLDGGDRDPFRAADSELAALLHVPYHVWPGAHDSKYWDAHTAAYLRFYAAALARCHRSTSSQ
jgi:S-formylglutathione hydrolase FrmB